MDLISLLSNEFNMEMLNTPESPHTWSSNRSDQRDGTLDLVWIEDRYTLIGDLQI